MNRISIVARRSARLFTLGAAISCGGSDSATSNDPPQSTPVLTSISVVLAPSAIAIGQNATATATGRDQFGVSMATGTVTWSSSSDQIASVNASGTVRGVAPGQAGIIASAGAVIGSTAITVTSPVQPAPLCKLPAPASQIGLGFPRNANRLKNTGDVRVAVVFVDFSDAPATRTPQSAFAILSPLSVSYFAAVSFGRMNLVLEPSFVWRRMSKPSTDYGWSGLTFNSHRAYIQEALDLATASVDFSQSDAVVIVSNPDAGALTNGPAFTAGAGSGVTADGKQFLSATTSGRDLIGWGGYWLNHEMGHTLGLPDLYASSGATHRFVGGFSLMGLISGHAREFFGWERWILGWIDDDQVACVGGGTTEVVLSPVERSGGTKIVAIPIGATTAVVVESRHAEGYDTNGPFTQGILVYYIDTSIASSNGVLKVLPINDADTNKGTAPLQIGGSLTFSGVTVTFVSQDVSGDRVRIAR